jgi:hypothetical protein
MGSIFISQIVLMKALREKGSRGITIQLCPPPVSVEISRALLRARRSHVLHAENLITAGERCDYTIYRSDSETCMVKSELSNVHWVATGACRELQSRRLLGDRVYPVARRVDHELNLSSVRQCHSESIRARYRECVSARRRRHRRAEKRDPQLPNQHDGHRIGAGSR